MGKQTPDKISPEGGITWLASYPKSGSTWLRMFLACYQNDGRPINFNSLPRNLTYADHRDQDYHTVSPYPVEHLTPSETLLLRGAVLLKLLSDGGGRPIMVKTHNANIVLDHVKLIPPLITKNAICVVRDPRDVAISLSRWTESTVDEAIELMEDDRSVIHANSGRAQTVFHYLGNWSKHVKSWMESEFDVTVIRYERLHEDPEYMFTQVLQQMDWEVFPHMVTKAIKCVAFAKMQGFEKKHGFYENPGRTGDFFRSGTVGQWKKDLSKKQISRITKEHGGIMDKLGYL